MANRLLLGKNTNSNHGHSTSSPGYGLYISRPGKDVETCTADELIFNTDNGASTSISRAIGLFQIPAIPIAGGGTDSSVSSTVSAGSTATISISSINFNLDLGFFSFGFIPPTTVGSTTTDSNFSFSSSTTQDTFTIENRSTTNLTIKAYVIPRYSSLAFF